MRGKKCRVVYTSLLDLEFFGLIRHTSPDYIVGFTGLQDGATS